MNKQTQQGGVFFYILLAIILLAGLTYAVSQNNRGNTDLITDEQARVAATEIIEYGNTVANAIQKLKLRGCKDTEINFKNNTYKTHGGTVIQPDGHNSNAPSNGSCDVYKSAGANINTWLIPDYALYQWNPASNNSGYGVINARHAAIEGVGNATQEELFLAGVYIKDPICMKINDLLGINNPSNHPPNSTRHMSTYDGVFADNGTYTIPDDDGFISGKTAFCIASSSGNQQDNLYVQVLITG